MSRILWLPRWSEQPQLLSTPLAPVSSSLPSDCCIFSLSFPQSLQALLKCKQLCALDSATGRSNSALTEFPRLSLPRISKSWEMEASFWESDASGRGSTRFGEISWAEASQCFWKLKTEEWCFWPGRSPQSEKSGSSREAAMNMGLRYEAESLQLEESCFRKHLLG